MEDIVRDARPEDALRVHEIMVADHTMTGTMRVPHQPLEYTQNRMASDPAVFKLVAMRDGKVAGYAELVTRREAARHSHVGEINMICVHPDSLRKGVARQLMAEMIRMSDDWLRLKRLGLYVWTDNSGAISLYQEFGFEVEGTLWAYVWRKGEFLDAHVMGRIV